MTETRERALIEFGEMPAVEVGVRRILRCEIVKSEISKEKKDKQGRRK